VITNTQTERERKILYSVSVKGALATRLGEERKKISTKLALLKARKGEVLIGSAREIGRSHMADFDFSAFNNLNVLQREIENCEKILHKIRKALFRLAGGRYGICEECDQNIRANRLVAVPWADKCTPCKTKKNEEEKRAKARLH